MHVNSLPPSNFRQSMLTYQPNPNPTLLKTYDMVQTLAMEHVLDAFSIAASNFASEDACFASNLAICAAICAVVTTWVEMGRANTTINIKVGKAFV